MNKVHQLIHRLHNPDVATLLIRLALGIVFINAGWMKIANMEMTIEAFSSMNIPAWLTYVVTYSELVGGALLILGLFVRYAAVVLAVIMLVASIILSPAGFSLAKGGYEYPFVLLLVSLALVTLGAGKYSLARVLKK